MAGPGSRSMRYLIGVGSYLAGDDSIGPRVIEQVVTQGLDRGFDAIDLLSGGLNLVSYLTPETEAIVIVDSARMGLAPGAMRFFRPEDVVSNKALRSRSSHEGDLLQALALAQAMGYPRPRLEIMGIEPATVDAGLELSPILAGRLPEYVAAAVERILRL